MQTSKAEVERKVKRKKSHLNFKQITFKYLIFPAALKVDNIQQIRHCGVYLVVLVTELDFLHPYLLALKVNQKSLF